MSSIKFFLYVLLVVGVCTFVAGCSSSHDTSSGEDEFFVPLDSSQVPSIPRKNQAKQEEPKSVPTSGSLTLTTKPESTAVPLTGLVVDTGAEVSKYVPSWDQQSQFLALPRGRYTAQSLRDSINLVTEQINLLQTILEASTIDRRMYYHAHVKAWYISNPPLRDSLFYALMAVDSSIQSEAGTDAEVLATEDNDLIEVRFGTGVFKGVTLKQALEKSSDKFLVQKVKESSLYSKDIELRDTTFKLPTPFENDLLTGEKLLDQFSYVTIHSNPEPVKARVDLSLYGLNFRVGPKWGGDVRIGNDELGLPFWSSGKISYLVMYKQIKAGLEFPFKGGRGSSDQFVVPLSTRLLEGTHGFVGECDFGEFGGSISFSKMSDKDLNSVVNQKQFYYITEEILGYTSFGFGITQTSLARVKVGVGHHQVRQGQVLPNLTDFLEVNKFNVTSIYLRFDFSHYDLDEAYGCSFQYYNASLLTTAWLQIVPHLLRLEVKYAKPVLRTVSEWESADFIMISPRLTLSF